MAARQRVWMRHAQSADNAEGRISGWRDAPLTPEGVQQARQQAWAVARFGIMGIVASDLTRAQETARIIQRTLALPPPQWLPALRERNWGGWEGTTRTRMTPQDFERGAPGGETLDALRKRMRQALAGLPKGVLVITHAGWLRCWMEDQVAGADTVPAPGTWVVDPDGACEAPFELRLEGTVLTPGDFDGQIQYVAHEGDLAGLHSRSIALLAGCSKSVAVEALDRACAAINLMRSLTAHLSFGRLNAKPYAIARCWPDGLPPDGALARLVFLPVPDPTHDALFPDVKPVAARAPAGWGGKAAGLHLLRKTGFAVPTFQVITAHRLALWKQRGLMEAAKTWTERNLAGRRRWAVRSSADVEDSLDDPLSGSFESRLNCPVGRVAEAIAEVASSAENREIRKRMRAGKLQRAPRMAIVVQQMTPPPLISGTVFVPAPDNPAQGLIECCIRGLSDALMDGRAAPDLSVRFDAAANLAEAETLFGTGLDRRERTALAAVASQALRIYRLTGRGDLEFAVDRRGRCLWLQARMLPSVVEIVDRRGFAPAATRYYKRLAFYVAKANRTKQPYFRCLDLPDGRFGYTVGIRMRDQVFRERILQDIKLLKPVVRFGWRAEKRMARMVETPETFGPDVILRALILHGAVQLPFSMPVRTELMDRYNSESIGSDASEYVLENVFDNLTGGKLGFCGSDILRVLWQPRSFVSAVSADRVLCRLMRKHSRYSLRDGLDYLAHELRDLPDLSKNGREVIRAHIRNLINKRLATDPDATELEERISESILLHQASIAQRADLLSEARKLLKPSQWTALKLWADYLEMKAETNETHSVYRGRCFIWFALIGYNPNSTSARSEWTPNPKGN